MRRTPSICTAELCRPCDDDVACGIGRAVRARRSRAECDGRRPRVRVRCACAPRSTTRTSDAANTRPFVSIASDGAEAPETPALLSIANEEPAEDRNLHAGARIAPGDRARSAACGHCNRADRERPVKMVVDAAQVPFAAISATSTELSRIQAATPLPSEASATRRSEIAPAGRLAPLGDVAGSPDAAARGARAR